jgi:RHS repeat-associated protein
VASGSDPPSVLTTTRGYDDLDRLTSETSPLPDSGSRSVGYAYFANGTRKTVSGPSGETSSYTYDGQNRLATAVTAGGSTAYAYFPDDLLRLVTYPNGVTSTHGYDKADRLTSIANARAASVLSSFVYSYDRNGNRLSQIETNHGPAETTSYTYDPLNRLATITYPVDLAFPLGRVVTYGFDAVGNRTRETEKTPAGAVLADKQGVFDNLNRLTTLTDLVDGSKTTAFTWDANGNQRTRTVAGVTTEYRYDCRDKMVEVEEGASTPGRFQYDFEGWRSKKIGADGIVQYVYDQTSVLAEFDSAGLELAKYDYGSDRLISMVRSGGVGAEGRRWYSLDGLRSVVGLTDDSGATVASYHLDAWGNFRFPTELSASRNHFAFTGYEWDPELGLFNAKARYFDPQVGRFLSQDSFLGEIQDPPSLHRYFYANDNPARFVDPTGHFSMQYAADFTSGFWSDLKVNAGARAVKIAQATGRNAVNLVEETGANIADATALTVEAATGIDTGYQLRSGTAEQAARRMAAGESAASVTGSIAGNTALNVATFGIYGTAKEQYETLDAYSEGKIGVEEVEDRLADAAGGAIVNVAATSVASKVLGQGWMGPKLPSPKVVLESATQLAGNARAAVEGGLDALHDAIGKNDFTTLGRIEPPPPEGPRPITDPSRLLTTGNPTTLSLAEVRALAGRARWQAAETYARELYGSGGQRHFPVPTVE